MQFVAYVVRAPLCQRMPIVIGGSSGRPVVWGCAWEPRVTQPETFVEGRREILRQASVALGGRPVTIWEVSARADTSQIVTGRPPRATLAWRRISRLPSTNVSGCVTRGSHAHPHTTGRPDEPPIPMGIRWHKGARTPYATNCINRQAKRGRGFAPHVRRAYCSGNGRWSPTKGTLRDAPESLPHTARWARPARSHRRPAGS